ncbi:hypothetical protein F2P81_020472 [Scophthalmus maximus]|uniref:Uncharacterized protein n=1 Tax=Scophthalmus maximus TaxID=52904 RepID=A0A6A4S9H0_SCOMX|nr:hypothetical protein F2P81_020472 [Scophthalmus maximus]
MSEVVYEETATMIAAGELQSFVPFGREHCRNHPNAFNLQLRELQPASELWSSDGAAGLVGSLQEVSLHERERECWQLRKGCIGAREEDVEFEEELYAAGNVVVWSQGSRTQASNVYKAFTVDSPVQQVADVWATKFGLLLERKNAATDAQLSPPGEPLPTLFSMLHPLDEIAPVVCKPAGLFEGSRVQYASESSMKILFSCCQPSIVVSYDTIQGIHIVWALRKVTNDERSAVLRCPAEPVGTPLGLMASGFLTSHLRNISRLDSPGGSGAAGLGHGTGTSCPVVPGSPLHYSALHSHQSRMMTSSPGLHSRVHSPSISNMAALRGHHGLVTSPNNTVNETMLVPEVEPIVPDLCMEQLWSETVTAGCHREMSSQASKVFLTSDVCENRYLCFLVESHQQLRCVKFIESNDTSQLIFASVTSIPAKDAEPLQTIDAMLVLEACGSLVVYTGITRVSKVFVPGLLSPTFNLTNHRPNLSTPVENVSTPANAGSRHIHRMDEALMPSPVSELRGPNIKHHEASFLEDYTFQQAVPYIHALRDPVCNRVTLVLVKWYNIYNAPGGPSAHAEWNLFVTCFMTLMGYNTERLSWTRNASSPCSPSLKLDSSAPLFPHIPALFYVLHLLYQELQLDELQRARASSLVCLLQQLARDLKLDEYVDLYWRDNPSLITGFTESCLIDHEIVRVKSSALSEMQSDHLFVQNVCDCFSEHKEQLRHGYALYITGDENATSTDASKYLVKLSAGQKSCVTELHYRRQSSVKIKSSGESLAEQLVVWLTSEGFTLKDLESVPFGVALPVREAIYRCREQPSSDWSEEVCMLIGRQDLTKQAHKMTLAKNKASVGSGLSLEPPVTTEADEEEDGMSDIIQEVTGLIWSQDLRVQEVRRLLQSSRPVRVSVVQLPEVSDHEYIEEKENKLLQLCQRTMALPVGRGLFTLFSYHPVPTEPLPVPKLNLTGRPPGPEMEYCTDRESYSLAAGLALGMVCLGHGSNLIGMTDLNVPEQLYQYMVGGHRRAQAGANRERHKSPSYQIKEGDTINVDVTCPGATLALAMIYLKTNNRSIADWLKPPDTWFLLDFIKPEFLLLRIMRGTFDPSEDINMETMAQAQDYITAGACMALGLRFAGSANSDAFDCLYEFARTFMKIMSFAGTAAVQTGYYNLQTGLSMILLAMSMVMSGTGNLKVLQLCRFFHKRTGGEMNYGFHMAHHMALGLLFLGGGRYTLSTSNSAIAALLCALYPHFPAHSTDNRYHLQALRHLAVLAAEPRLLVPVDVDSLKPCYALLEVTYKETKWYEETTVELMAPTMLPELHHLKRVKVKGPRYWELSVDLSKETQHLQSILSRDGVLYVKLRAGQLPYKDDPQGWKSLLASTVNHRNSGVQAFKPEAISTFTSEPALVSFAEFFCKASDEMKQAVGALRRGDLLQTFPLWQLRLVVELWDSRVLRLAVNRHDALLTSEFLPVMKNMADTALDSWLRVEPFYITRTYHRGFQDVQVTPQSSTDAEHQVKTCQSYALGKICIVTGCDSDWQLTDGRHESTEHDCAVVFLVRDAVDRGCGVSLLPAEGSVFHSILIQTKRRPSDEEEDDDDGQTENENFLDSIDDQQDLFPLQLLDRENFVGVGYRIIDLQGRKWNIQRHTTEKKAFSPLPLLAVKRNQKENYFDR